MPLCKDRFCVAPEYNCRETYKMALESWQRVRHESMTQVKLREFLRVVHNPLQIRPELLMRLFQAPMVAS